MQQPIPTSAEQTLPRGETESTFYPAGFPVSPILRLGKGKALPTTATCGQKCLEQYAKSDRVGYWGKMFSGLLIGMEGWFSSRCTLTWKLKVTPFRRSYFQLAVRTPRTKDIERGLLPTVTTTNSNQGFHSTNSYGVPLLPMAALQMGAHKASTLLQNEMSPLNIAPTTEEAVASAHSTNPQIVGLLPTPVTMNMKGSIKVSGKKIARKSGTNFTSGLRDLAFSGLLPIPEATEADKETKTLDLKSHVGSGSSMSTQKELLPTPTAFDRKTCHQTVTGKTITRGSGETFTAGLRMLAPNGLLPTPRATESIERRNMITIIDKVENRGDVALTTLVKYHSMLPTPIAGDWKGQVRSDGTANMLCGKIALMAKSGNLPTPTARCHNAGTTVERKDGISRNSELNHLVARSVGKSSQLNPLFVEEMMGFPPYYTVLPFLDGEKNP